MMPENKKPLNHIVVYIPNRILALLASRPYLFTKRKKTSTEPAMKERKKSIKSNRKFSYPRYPRKNKNRIEIQTFTFDIKRERRIQDTQKKNP